MTRSAGVLVPLFSLASTRSWGIGEIGDIAATARWLDAAGARLLQLLPINEMPPGEASPYSALSAMAIDPQFISLADVEDFDATGGEEALGSERQGRLAAVRASASVQLGAVRELKQHALRNAFRHFRKREWGSRTRRAEALRIYAREQAWWLDDYALFRAIHADRHEASWTEWPEPLRARHPDALSRVREKLADEILFRQYTQWIADAQWARARKEAGVALFGDLPFMVSGDSADVWARQDQFRMDASVGVPPDAFSATGQDWGLPVYRWDVCEATGFEWLRKRARRNADLFDGYRIDHLVGFYRTYFRPADGGDPQFMPADKPAQKALGERVLQVFRDSGAEITAEDLGTVPDFVRASLAALHVPGYKVFRWERDWHVDNQPFKDPRGYDATAVVTSGTHDTEPMVVWWEAAPRAEREAVLNIPSIAERVSPEDRQQALETAGLPRPVMTAMLEALYAAGADLLILPIQDLFGWRDRINQPATVNDQNWTWRLPWPVDRLLTEPAALAVASQLAKWSRQYDR